MFIKDDKLNDVEKVILVIMNIYVTAKENMLS